MPRRIADAFTRIRQNPAQPLDRGGGKKLTSRPRIVAPPDTQLLRGIFIPGGFVLFSQSAAIFVGGVLMYFQTANMALSVASFYHQPDYHAAVFCALVLGGNLVNAPVIYEQLVSGVVDYWLTLIPLANRCFWDPLFCGSASVILSCSRFTCFGFGEQGNPLDGPKVTTTAGTPKLKSPKRIMPCPNAVKSQWSRLAPKVVGTIKRISYIRQFAFRWAAAGLVMHS